MLRAIYEWLLDNNCTPHLLVNALADDVLVPQEHVKDGQIVLNLSPTAVRDLHMDNEAIACSGRFGGVPRELYVPVDAVMGLYARENGQGMLFADEDLPEPDGSDPDAPGPGAGDASGAGAAGAKAGKGKPGLRLVK